MKRKIHIIALTVFLLFQLLLYSCKPSIDENTGPTPFDYPNTKWICEEVDMYFIISSDSTLQYAEIVDNTGKTIKITFECYSENPAVTVKNINGIDTYFSGVFESDDDVLSLTMVGLYNSKFLHLPSVLTFKRVDLE